MDLEPGQLVTRMQVSNALAEGFGIKQGERMVRYALDAFKIGAKERRPRQGEPGGPVSYFDPIVLWTVASVYHRQRQTLKGGHDALLPYRELARVLAVEPLAEGISGFRDDEDLAAQLLLIGSPDLGLDPLHRIIHIKEHPWLVAWCGQGESFMRLALSSWDSAYEDLLAFMRPDQSVRTGAERRDHAAAAFVRAFGTENGRGLTSAREM